MWCKLLLAVVNEESSVLRLGVSLTCISLLQDSLINRTNCGVGPVSVTAISATRRKIAVAISHVMVPRAPNAFTSQSAHSSSMIESLVIEPLRD